MTEAMKSLASIVRGSIRAGAKVSFTKENLKVMGIRVTKAQMYLIKPSAPIKPVPKEVFKVCSFKFKLPVRTINLLKQKAVKASKPYNIFIGELLTKAALQGKRF